MKTYLVVGASRGIGEAVSEHLVRGGNRVIGVSRTQPRLDEWIPADVSIPDGIRRVGDHLGNTPLDGFLYLGGVWEQDAFTDDFDFQKSSDAETRFVIAVNLIAPIELTRGVARNLAMTPNPRAVFIGSLSGLDQLATPEAANTASKFGLRGAIQSLRLTYREIGFTVINPGNVSTPEVLEDIEAGRFPEQEAIPIEDVFRTIDWLFSVSRTTEVGDINLFQKNR